ncbi:MAG: PHP domain-containing protein [Chloroflexota bacterium]|nr:PHP domain-containing protein [Chloroflexota bacterium]
MDLHCHASASFDGVAGPEAVVARAAERGLTHLAITDHDTLEGAMRAVEAAPAGLCVIVGCEVTTRDGDLVRRLSPAPSIVSVTSAVSESPGRPLEASSALFRCRPSRYMREPVRLLPSESGWSSMTK